MGDGWPRLLVDGIPDPVFVCRFDGSFADVNAAAARRLACTRDELMAATAFDVCPDLTPELFVFAREVTAHTSVMRPAYHRRRDGDTYAVQAHLSQVGLDEGPLLVVCERVLGAAEPALPRVASARRALAGAALAVDAGGRISFASDDAGHVLGLGADLLVGRAFADFCSGPVVRALLSVLENGARVGPRPPMRGELRRLFGDRFPAEVQIAPWEAAGTPFLSVVLRDLSEEEPGPEWALPEPTPEPPCLARLVGESAPMRALRARIRALAASDANVLILGETGTGKELVARAIHELSPRNAGPFAAVNSGALPASLIDSELFGHERGAFTGADERRPGCFEAAGGGTLFLDEIGELPLELQTRLLRVLQERKITRLGSRRPLPVDVRVVAATNRDLASAVARGAFREDLYHRLNVLPIEVPPLRARRDDIPLLARAFLRAAAQRGGPCTAIDAEVMRALAAHDWSGNVRELENVIERAVVMRGRVEIEDIGGRPRLEPTDERERILQTLERTGWRISGPRGAALVLGLKPTTLEARMKRLGIQRPRM